VLALDRWTNVAPYRHRVPDHRDGFAPQAPCPHCYGQRMILEAFADGNILLEYLPVVCETCRGSGRRVVFGPAS